MDLAFKMTALWGSLLVIALVLLAVGEVVGQNIVEPQLFRGGILLFKGLLALCHLETSVMLSGPSAPLSPVLADCGMERISGTRVVDEAEVMHTGEHGASFREVEGVNLLTYVQKEKK